MVKKQKPNFYYGWVIAASGMLIVAGALGFARFGYSMILPEMQDSLELTSTQMGLLASGNLAGYLSFTLIAGLLSTFYGQRLLITFSMLLASSTMVLTGFSKTFSFAFLMRTFTGIGSGGANVPVMSLASIWFSPKRRGKAAGIMAAGSGIGLIITGFLIPNLLTLSDANGWRYAWYSIGIISLAFTAIGFITIKNSPKGDVINTIQRSVGIEEYKKLYRNPALIHLGLAYFMFGFSYIIYATFFAAYIVKEVELTVVFAGQLWMFAGALSIFSGFIWGSISDWLGRKYGLTAVYAIQAISYAIFATSRDTGWLSVSAFLFGITAWSVPSIMAAAAGDCSSPKQASAALAFITTFFFGVGQALAPYLAGYLRDLTGSFYPVFMLSTLTALVGLALSISLRQKYFKSR